MSDAIPITGKFVVWFHLVAAILAVGLGSFQLLRRPRGDAIHKALGRGWIMLMMIVAVSSFWIRELGDGEFSWIHALSVWTLFCLFMAVRAIRRGNVRRHALFMTGTLAGAIIAGVFALLPGRFISDILNYAAL